MKRVLIYLIFFILISSIVQAPRDDVLITPSRLDQIKVGWAPDQKTPDVIPPSNSDVEDPQSMDTYPDSALKDTSFYNVIHVADYTGRPRFEFKSYENVYLKDRRIPLSSSDFNPRYEYQEYDGNTYEPFTDVDVYVLFDQQFYEDDVDRLRLLKSAIAESRTRTQIFLEKITVQTDENGKIPFLNLGKIGDLYTRTYNTPSYKRTKREGHAITEYAQSGHHGTLDYSDTPGNRLSDSPYKPAIVNFDIFVDADRDGAFSPYGDHYYVLGVGFRKEDQDYFLYASSPAFSVNLNTIRNIKSCCVCEEGSYISYNLGDAADCSDYCVSQYQDPVSWSKGDCEEESSIAIPVQEEEVQESGIEEQNDKVKMLEEKVSEMNQNIESMGKEMEESKKESENPFVKNFEYLKPKLNVDNLRTPALIFIFLLLFLIFVALALSRK